MEDNSHRQHIIDKIEKGMHFALFESGSRCFFEDGERVRYNDLWDALNTMHNITSGSQGKSLATLCPNTYEGAFSYKFSRHKWRRQ